RRAQCFLRLDPARLGTRLAEAATIAGASTLGEPVTPAALGHIDLIVAGSVAVTAGGARLRQGGGFSDLAVAVAPAPGGAEPRPRVVRASTRRTTHAVPLVLIVTPRARDPDGAPPAQAGGIVWPELSDEQRREIPALRALRSG